MNINQESSYAATCTIKTWLRHLWIENKINFIALRSPRLPVPISFARSTMFAPFSHIKQEINTCASQADSISCRIWPIRFVGARTYSCCTARARNLLQHQVMAMASSLGNRMRAAPDKARKKRSKQAILLLVAIVKWPRMCGYSCCCRCPGMQFVRGSRQSIEWASKRLRYLITLATQAVRSSL